MSWQREQPDGATASTLMGVLGWRAAHQAERRAYTFLADGERDSERLSYGELHAGARRIAAQLATLGRRGERAILFYPPGLAFVQAFLGCLSAGVIAVPAPSPRRPLHRSLPRIEALLAGARPSIGLTTADTLALLAPALADRRALADVTWIATDGIATDRRAEYASRVALADPDPAELAFLQYTSGSTSSPRGVMISHRNLVSNLELLARGFAFTPASVMVTWLPMFHDMGLVLGLLSPLFGGFPCIAMPALSFVMRPSRWLAAITRFGGTVSAAPNFAYDLCVERVTAEERRRLDLATWAIALNAAEPIRKRTIDAFTAAFASCGFGAGTFCGGYGLAEATVKVTSGTAGGGPVFLAVSRAALGQGRVVVVPGGDPDAQVLVGSGTLSHGASVAIVDPDTCIACAPDHVGEIWVTGPSVARGYFERPTDTEDTFGGALAGSAIGPWLRTGDLGFIADGELFVTARARDLLIVAGVNHFPQDIEISVKDAHPLVRAHGACAFSIEVESSERAVVVAEVALPRRSRMAGEADAAVALEPSAIIASIRRKVADDHDLALHAVVLVPPGAVPKTSSGKMQRGLCRATFLAGELPAIELHD